MKSVFKYLKEYRKQAICAPLFKMLEALLDLFVPLLIANIIDAGIAHQDMHVIVRDFILLVFLSLLGLGFSIVAQYFAAKAAVGCSTSLRQALFDHIQEMSYQVLDTLGTNTLITRITSDINQIQQGLNLGLRLALRSPFIVFGSLILAFTINRRIAFIFLIVVIILIIVVFTIMLVSIPLYKNVQQSLDHVTSLTQENLEGVRVIRAFNHQKKSVEEFDEANDQWEKISVKVGHIAALMNPLTFLIINIGIILLIYSGAIQVSMGNLAQGQVVALYNYMAQVLVELIKLADLIIQMNRAAACSERVDNVLNIDTGMKFSDQSVIENTNGSVIQVKDMSFQYASDREPVLKKMNFSIERGQTIGIIGGTGSGKSTLVNLFPRFYDVQRGSILVDGVDVRDYPKKELRNKFGIVPQKAVLFAGTIRDNLLWGNEQASEEDLKKSIQDAQAEDVVNKKGLDGIVEQNGKNFSGGQRQRLTIARALVKNPEILILDDSASALDYATDARLRKSIHHLSKTMTTIIVSQRISSIRHADQILVLDHGCLAGIGTHESLLKDNLVYREIYQSQYPEEEI